MNVLLAILTKPLTVAAEAGQWFLSLSMAGRIAVAVAVFQVFLVVLALSVILVAGGIPIFQAWWTPGKGVALILLMLIVPGLAFLAAQLWLHHDVARWPDIDNAWQAARVELDRQAIDVRTTPLFLVVGLDGRSQEQILMDVAPGGLLVKAAPPGSAPLHVYAGPEALFVSLSGIGATCALVNPGGSAAGTEPAPRAPDARGDGATAAGDWRGGVVPRQRLDDASEHAAADRLRTLCEWLQTARQPVAALNGVVIVVPFSDEEPAVTALLGAAVNADLQVILSTVGLRVPVTIAWRGLERLPGFKELLAALPGDKREAAMGTPWPAGLMVTQPLATDLATATCNALIDRVGDHLLLPQSLQQTAVNRALVSLVCRLRLMAGTTMALMLQRIVALSEPTGGPPPIAGSYFVATGTPPGPDCFVRGMLDRVVAVQGELVWMSRRLLNDRRCQMLGRLLGGLDILLLAGIVGVIWWRVAG